MVIILKFYQLSTSGHFSSERICDKLPRDRVDLGTLLGSYKLNDA